MNISLQTLKKYATNPCIIDAGKNDGEPVFYWFGDILPYSFAHDCCDSIRHTGWFTNSDGTTCRDGSGKCVGVVIHLPPSPGFPEGRFLAGYWWGDNGEFVAWPELFRDESEAARAADSRAESFAKTAREDNTRFEAMREAEDESESLEKPARMAYMARNVSADHREAAREALQALRESRETFAERTAEYERG